MKRAIASLLIIAAVALLATPTLAGQLFISPTGEDANPGTEDRPFATLQRARDEIRQLKAAGPLPFGGITVELLGGIYQLSEPLELTEDDSGTEEAPIVYRARKGETVKIVGGRQVTGWTEVSDPAVLKRLNPAARGQTWQADLKALGITDLEGINNARTYQSDPGLEVFFDDKPMTLARYPNSGYMHIAGVTDSDGKLKTGDLTLTDGKFVCDDPRPGRWEDEKEIWLHGFWRRDWCDIRIPLAAVDAVAKTVTLGLAPGSSFTVRSGQWFYAENVLPELDSPGEWYLDRDNSILYLWPPAPLSSGQATVSVVRDLFRLNQCLARHLPRPAGRNRPG